MRRLILLCLLSVVAAEVGNSKEDEWAYQWYEGESFSIRCQAAMSLNNSHTVAWNAPGEARLLNTTSSSRYYEVRDIDGVPGAEIYVKSVKPEVHGVYVCNVNTLDGEFYNRSIFALNYRDVKYHSLGTKYRSNFIVAVVSAVVFLVPVITLCVLHHYSWEKRHPEYKTMYAGNSHEFKMAYIGDHEAKGEVNPAFQTQL